MFVIKFFDGVQCSVVSLSEYTCLYQLHSYPMIHAEVVIDGEAGEIIHLVAYPPKDSLVEVQTFISCDYYEGNL